MNGDPLTFDSPVQQRGFELQTQTAPVDYWKISADAVRRHYDLTSFAYPVFWGEHLHHGLFLTGSESPRQAQIQLLEFCSTLLKIRQGSKVLDVGCGYGGSAIYLASNFRCNVDGLTLSPKQVRIARKKNRTSQDQRPSASLGRRCGTIKADWAIRCHLGNGEF